MQPPKQSAIPFDRTQFAGMSKEARLEDFKKRTVAHPHLEEVDQALTEAILEPGGASIIFLYGPARVGKTVMIHHVMRTLTLLIQDELERDRERFAFLYTNLHPPMTGFFSWKSYFQDGLTGLHEPLISHKILLDDEQEESQAENTEHTSVTRKHPFRRPEGTADALRASYETVVQRRRPLAVINDEAQHIGKVGSGKRHQDQLDVIKSLADVTQTVHVLVGTYELLPLSQLSAQLIGRSIDVHFPRYLPNKKDQHKFKRLLKSFQEFMPFEEEPDTLLDNWQFCYERSIGCIGNLRLMLVRAVKAALWSNQKTLTKEVLEKHADSENDWPFLRKSLAVLSGLIEVFR